MDNRIRIARRCLVGLWLGLCLVMPTLAQDRDRDQGRQEQRDDDRHRAQDRDDHERDRDRDDDQKPKVQVALTAPAAGTLVAAPATITLAASAQALQHNHSIVRVEFYQGSTLIGTATSAPYSVTWSNVTAGHYSLTAKAYGRATERRDAQDARERDHDDRYDIAVSAPVAILVDAPPTVSLAAPTAGTVVTAPGSLTLTANATDSDGSIAKVEFYQGGTLIGTAAGSPYSIPWSNVPAGSYTLTAKATDDHGISTISAPVAVIVNAPPTVTLTSPAEGQVVAAPGTVTLSANAADSDGSIAKVEFYQGATLIGTATTAPYTLNWSNAAAGTYSITARAMDNDGAATTSAPAQLIVDAPPTVTLTSPTPNQMVIAPGNVTITANAADSDGAIAKVEFYQGTTLIGTATSAPYSVSWSNVPAGTYNITAKATDNYGIATTSVPVPLIVDAPPTVSLTSPTAGQVVTAPGNLMVIANAADSDGTVTKVDFYQGTTLIGTATTAPYTMSWSNVAAGTYSLTAVATDNLGAATTSIPVSVIVNAPPTVTLTTPTAGQIVAAPGSVTLTATAADSDGSIAKVDFYQGTTLIGSATAAPYTLAWSNVPAETYSLTAVATDNLGASTTSAAVTLIVDAPPTVTLTAPANNARLVGPADVTLSATATDSDGTIAKVDFYQGSTLIGTAATAPYAITWSNVPPGSYSFTAVATDNQGITTTSAPVNVTMVANVPPTVTLTSPAAGQKFTAPANIALAVNAADTYGSVASVTYFQNGNPIGTVTTAPFGYTWTNVPQGSYAITAQATDSYGAQTISAPVTVTVNAAGPALGIYYIHPDHLGTPRLITDQQQNIVWRWDNAEPFGNTPPNADPGNTGTPFTFNLRFPGQYFDSETGLSYNYFRDGYDPMTGRYIQSDPIGLRGGVNTYSYVGGNPLKYSDPFGLSPLGVGGAVGGSGGAAGGFGGLGGFGGRGTGGSGSNSSSTGSADLDAAAGYSYKKPTWPTWPPGGGDEPKDDPWPKDDKNFCIRTYVNCQNYNWTGNCQSCLDLCKGSGSGDWPFDMCKPRKKNQCE